MQALMAASILLLHPVNAPAAWSTHDEPNPPRQYQESPNAQDQERIKTVCALMANLQTLRRQKCAQPGQDPITLRLEYLQQSLSANALIQKISHETLAYGQFVRGLSGELTLASRLKCGRLVSLFTREDLVNRHDPMRRFDVSIDFLSPAALEKTLQEGQRVVSGGGRGAGSAHPDPSWLPLPACPAAKPALPPRGGPPSPGPAPQNPQPHAHYLK